MTLGEAFQPTNTAYPFIPTSGPIPLTKPFKFNIGGQKSRAVGEKIGFAFLGIRQYRLNNVFHTWCHSTTIPCHNKRTLYGSMKPEQITGNCQKPESSRTSVPFRVLEYVHESYWISNSLLWDLKHGWTKKYSSNPWIGGTATLHTMR